MKINALFFSHFGHLDHVLDLPAFITQRRAFIEAGLVNEKNELKLFGPKGFNDFFSKLKEAFPSIKKAQFKISVEEMGYSNKKLFDFVVKSKPVKHSVETIGFRVESCGKVFAFGADTEYCQEVVDLGKEADLLVLECTTAKKTSFHLNPRDCARVASEANAKKLMLTHFWPETEKLDLKKIVGEKFSGEVLVAEDLLKVKI